MNIKTCYWVAVFSDIFTLQYCLHHITQPASISVSINLSVLSVIVIVSDNVRIIISIIFDIILSYKLHVVAYVTVVAVLQ